MPAFLSLASKTVRRKSLVAAVILFLRYAANRLTERLARVPELVVTISISLAAILQPLVMQQDWGCGGWTHS